MAKINDVRQYICTCTVCNFEKLDPPKWVEESHENTFGPIDFDFIRPLNVGKQSLPPRLAVLYEIPSRNPQDNPKQKPSRSDDAGNAEEDESRERQRGRS